MANDGRIVDWAPYGQHIRLQCKKCGAKGFTTKNIGSMDENGKVSLARNLHVHDIESMKCDAAGHKLEDLEVIKPKDHQPVEA